VPYFFYDTLADAETLYRKLDLDEMLVLTPAVVHGEKINMWSGKYRALVDAEEEDEVRGSMHVVETKEHEDVLRMYEGGNYEVVRSKIERKGGNVVNGLTLRFCGDGSTLEDV
jgi:hypothetical protein